MCPVSPAAFSPRARLSLGELVKPTEKLFNITRLRQRSDEALFGLILVRALDMEFNLVQLSQTWGKGSAVGVAAWIGLISIGTTNMCAKCPMLLQRSVKLAADFRALALLIQMKAIQ